MENLEKLELVIAKIKAVKGNLRGKRDRLKYYTESLELGRFKYVTLEQIENFDFEKEVINRQNVISEFRKPKKELKPYSLQEFKKDLGL
jgi:hypothetical protein